MHAITHWLYAALAPVVVVMAAGCSDQSDAGAPVAEKDLPSKLTLTLEGSSLDSPSAPIIRTFNATLVSPHDIPLNGLKWPRVVLSDDSDWPRGWRVLPGDIPFGVVTNGIPGGRQFTWQVNVLRTSASAQTSGEISLWLECVATPGGSATRTTSAPVQLEFPAEAEPHPVTEQDVRDAHGAVFLMVQEAQPGSLTSIIEIRPNGTFRSRSGAADTDPGTETTDVLTEKQRTQLHEALVEARAWTFLTTDADPDPRGNEPYVNVVLVAGDGSATRRGGASSFRSSADWLKLASVLSELTKVEIPAK